MSEGQNKTMLALNISPQVEDEVVDYLLSQSPVSGFTSYPVRGTASTATCQLPNRSAADENAYSLKLLWQHRRLTIYLQDSPQMLAKVLPAGNYRSTILVEQARVCNHQQTIITLTPCTGHTLMLLVNAVEALYSIKTP